MTRLPALPRRVKHSELASTLGSVVNEDVRLALRSEPLLARNLLNAVNRASEGATTAWLIYLALAAYFIVALAGVTHKDLLLNSPITLPILGISVALDRFFLFAPPLFILVHTGMMMEYVTLTRKIYAFTAVLAPEEQGTPDQPAKIHPMRYELDGNLFTQLLAGPSHAPIVGLLLQVIVWVTLVLLGAGVLLYFQAAFLPFHDVALTWAHRIYVLSDLLLVAVLGTFLPSPLTGFWASFFYGWRTYPLFMLVSTGLFASFFAFSMFIATVPDEMLDRIAAAFGPSVVVPAPSGNPADARAVFLPTAYLFESEARASTGRRSSPFQRNLIVMDADLVNDQGLAEGDITLSLRDRDLRYARLDRSDLKQADLTCADLKGASLEGAILSRAKRGCDAGAR